MNKLLIWGNKWGNLRVQVTKSKEKISTLSAQTCNLKEQFIRIFLDTNQTLKLWCEQTKVVFSFDSSEHISKPNVHLYTGLLQLHDNNEVLYQKSTKIKITNCKVQLENENLSQKWFHVMWMCWKHTWML